MKVWLNIPCKKCDCAMGIVEKKAMHNELRCSRCKSYIKNISKTDCDKLRKYEEPEEPINELAEINFKLDLILDHLGIKE